MNARNPNPQTAAVDEATDIPRRLLDLMSDGFYMLLLIKRGQPPTDMHGFTTAVEQFLSTVEREASKEGIANEDVHAAKYAYCAMVDETVLRAQCAFHADWERNPLQLKLFGDHLAGENFFAYLEKLRAQGAPRLQSLEVYYFCLLLGFQGKYLIEGLEKLHYLTSRLGDEIVYLRGKRTGFAPHWQRPDRVAHALRKTVPLWAVAAVLAVVSLTGYISLHHALATKAENQLADYQHVVEMPAKTASLTITLP